MLRWSIFFFLISIVAGILGFSGISEATSGIAQILFFIFIGIFLILLIAGLIAGKALAS